MSKTTYSLKYPYKGDGRQLETLTLRRLTMADMDRVNQAEDNLGQSKILVQISAGLSPDELANMDVADFEGVSRKVADFLS